MKRVVKTVSPEAMTCERVPYNVDVKIKNEYETI